MSYRVWVVASSSIGTVEGLKDQLGMCRWNYTIRSLQRHVGTSMRSFSEAAGGSGVGCDVEKRTGSRAEESFNKVMDLSCWGPNTLRF
uniref:Wound-responsive family protein n=1 Tax=Kalanchoe fedtschenkoi TaxID=63787 RepID=A0A7N1A5F8_KALFE